MQPSEMTSERQRHFPFRPVLFADGVRKGVEGFGMDGSSAPFLQDTSEGHGTIKSAERLERIHSVDV